MKFAFTYWLIWFFSFTSTLFSSFELCLTQLKEEAKAFQTAQVISGGAIGIIDGHRNKIHYIFLGDHSFRRPIAVNEFSEFRIGEVTQSVTGILLATLLRDGRVSLHDPIDQFFPRNAKIPTKNGKKISIQHLATHTSSLPNLPIEVFYMAPHSTRDILRSLANLELNFEPGEKYQFSRLGYAILGHILTRVSKQSLPILLKRTLTGPLQLEDTVFHYRANLERLMCGYKGGREISAKHFDVHSLAFQSACGLYSSVHDLSHLMQHYLLSDEPTAKAVREVIFASLAEDREGNCSVIGWKVSKELGGSLYESMSQSFGHSSYVGLLPEKKLGLVLLMNNQDAALKPLALRFFNLLLTSLEESPARLN